MFLEIYIDKYISIYYYNKQRKEAFMDTLITLVIALGIGVATAIIAGTVIILVRRFGF